MHVSARSRIATSAALAALLGLAAACSNPKASLGSPCLRSDDCEEGQCIALACRLPPTDDDARGSGGINAYRLDAGSATDAGAGDPPDAAEPPPDASPPDAAADAGSADSGSVDAAFSDAGSSDQ